MVLGPPKAAVLRLVEQDLWLELAELLDAAAAPLEWRRLAFGPPQHPMPLLQRTPLVPRVVGGCLLSSLTGSAGCALGP